MRSQWQLLKPLQEGTRCGGAAQRQRVRIDQLEPGGGQAPEVPQGALHPEPQQRPARPDDALDSRYQLRIGLLLADRPESAEYSQILQTLPERGFNLLYLMTSLLLVLLVSAAVLKAPAAVAAPKLPRPGGRQPAAWQPHLRAAARLRGVQAGEFLFWSGFRPEHYYLAWGSMVLGWSLCALAGFSLYMGCSLPPSRASAARQLHEDRHLRGAAGDDLGNLLALLHILLDQHPVVPVLVVLGLLFLVWRFALSRWILRACCAPPPPLAAFFALCVFATQTGNKLLGANIRYVDRAVNYHRDIIRVGPGLYLFNLVDEMLQSGNVFRYPLQINERTPELSLPAQPRAPRFDLVIVLQYESLWLDWQGRLCAPAPTLSLPASVAQWRKTIHSHHGGMTVLAEFEMNTGLPVGLLKQGWCPTTTSRTRCPALRAAQPRAATRPCSPTLCGEVLGPRQGDPGPRLPGALVRYPLHRPRAQGLYISDDALIDHLLKRSNQDDQPLFAYAVTMQGTALRRGSLPGPAAQRRLPGSEPGGYPVAQHLLHRGGGCHGLPGAAAQDPGQLRQALPGGGLRGPPALPDVGWQGHPRRQTATGCQLPDPHDGLHPTAGEGARSARQFDPVRQLYPDGPGHKGSCWRGLPTPSETSLPTWCSGEEKGFDLLPWCRRSKRQLPGPMHCPDRLETRGDTDLKNPSAPPDPQK